VKVLCHSTPLSDFKENIEIIHGDIRDYSLLEKSIEQGEIVFHLASALGASLITSKEFYEINAFGSRNILQASLKKRVSKFIYFSSAGVIGSVRNGEIADENYSLNPQDLYEKSKFQGEKFALEFGRKGLKVIIIRPGWVYGPGDKRTFKLIKAISTGRFFIIGKGNTFQTPVYIDDLIDGVFLCLEKGRPGEIYNLAGLEVLTVKEMSNIIAQQLGKKIPPFKLPLLPTKILAWSMDRLFRLFEKEAPLTPSKVSFFTKAKPLSIEKAKKELGYYPKTGFREGIRKTINWYRKQGWLPNSKN
jgi:dihydroflavonol-4-reductase